MIQLLQSGMPPSNLPYLIAAFAITGLVFLGYVFYIFRRRQETRTEIRRLQAASEEREGAEGESS